MGWTPIISVYQEHKKIEINRPITTVYFARPSLRLEARAKRAGLTKINIMRKKRTNNPIVPIAL